MKKNRTLIVCLVFLVLSFTLCAYAQALTINKILHELTSPRSTSLQKLDLIESYKGQDVSGSGRVKDILKSPGAENEALVYLKKNFKGKQYEIALTTSRENAVNIKKGKKIRFEGKFAGMSFETLRFEDVEIQ